MKLTTTAPVFCNENTNLGPYLESLIHSVRSLGEDRFLSVTHEIGYIDPLAILENSNQSNQPICYLERPANEFSIACSEFLSKLNLKEMTVLIRQNLGLKNSFEMLLSRRTQTTQHRADNVFNSYFRERSRVR